MLQWFSGFGRRKGRVLRRRAPIPATIVALPPLLSDLLMHQALPQGHLLHLLKQLTELKAHEEDEEPL